jgi:hypothetical protein
VTTPTPAPQRQPRGCLATLAVFLVMIGILVGGAYAANALAQVPQGPINVGFVSVQPLEGWEFGGRTEDGNTVLLSRGTGSLAITVYPDKSAVQALSDTRAEWVASGTVTASETTFDLSVRSGAPRFGYTGTFDDIATVVEGEVFAIDGTGYAVQFDGWAGTGEYIGVRDDIVYMINGAVIQ